MWLLEIHSLQLRSFNDPPEYAILSHLWGREDDEVSFAEMRSAAARDSDTVRSKPGFSKITQCCAQALKDGIDFVWIDTCCINKESSAELSEAINSMFQWYKDSAVCYAYLHDVVENNLEHTLRESKWFSRGWTLQELLAPDFVQFFDANWNFIGDKAGLKDLIVETTAIDVTALLGSVPLSDFSIAQRFSWAALRTTSRAEDQAYCLMGIFEVNLPLLYGEKDRAFIRLQEEIIRNNNDHSIFAWKFETSFQHGLLSPTPFYFRECSNVQSAIYEATTQPFQMTNAELRITLDLAPWAMDTYIAWLHCIAVYPGATSGARERRVGVFIKKRTIDDQFVRVRVAGESIFESQWTWHDRMYPNQRRTEIFVRQKPPALRQPEKIYGMQVGYLSTASVSDRLEDLLATALILRRTERFQGDHSVIEIPTGSSGLVFATAWEDHLPCRYIAFGFDFEFNPICIVHDTPCTKEQSCKRHAIFFRHEDFQTTSTDKWLTGWRDTVWPSEDHDGFWYLKGERFQGLNFTIRRDHGKSLRIRILPDFYERDGESYGIWKCSVASMVFVAAEDI